MIMTFRHWLGLILAGAAPAVLAQTPGLDLRDLKTLYLDHDLHERIPSQEAWRRQRVRRFDASDETANFEVKKYALNLAADPVTGMLSGTNRVTVEASQGALSLVRLDAYDMQITRVTDGTGRDLRFQYDGQTLAISLTMRPGDERDLIISYQAMRPQTFNVTGPDVSHPQRMVAAYTFTQPDGSRAWFPALDRPDRKALADIRVTVPAAYQVLSNGDLVERSGRDGRVTFAYRMDKAVATYLMSLAIGNYQVVSLGNFQGKPVSLWTPPTMRDKAVAETAATPKMMEVFSAFTGVDYPFNGYTQSVAQAWRASMEHQSATTMGAWRVTGDGTGAAVVAHELAHQWFGDWVTCGQWGELWLNEGFATYLPYVYFNAIGDTMNAQGQLDGWRSGYFSEAAHKVRPLSDLGMPLDDIFDSHSYEKGGLVLHLLRQVVNRMAPAAPAAPGQPEAFSRALQRYLSEHAQGNVANRDLQKAMEEVTGQSLETFFNEWVRSPGHPVLAVSYEKTATGARIRVRQEQALRAERRWGTFSFPLDVELYHTNGQVSQQSLQVRRADETFELSFNEPVVAINVDPQWFVPADVSVTQDGEAWRRVLQTSPSELGRTSAMRALVNASPLSESDLGLILADASDYVKTDALERLTARVENRGQVERLVQAMRQHASPALITRGAMARAALWLTRTRGTAVTANEEEKARQSYQTSPYSEERRSLLGLLVLASRERAQQFALERLTEATWTTRDRWYLIETLAQAPTPVSLPFIQSLLTSGTVIYQRQVLSLLLAANYDNPALFNALTSGIEGHRYTDVRAQMVSLLAKQKSRKAEACAKLAVYANHATSSSVDPWVTVRAAARQGLQTLTCP